VAVPRGGFLAEHSPLYILDIRRIDRNRSLTPTQTKAGGLANPLPQIKLAEGLLTKVTGGHAISPDFLPKINYNGGENPV
jgi:hypothetical protein